MKRHRVIITATALVMLAVGLLTLQLHHEEKREALSRIQHHQLLHAQHVARQMESFFRNYSQVLQALSSFGSFQRDDTKGTVAYIQGRLRQQGEAIIRSVSFHDETGTIIYSTERDTIGLDEGRSDFFSWAKKVGNKGRVFVSPPIFESGFLRIRLSTPLYREASGARHSNSNGNFAGVLSLTIDLKEFLANQLHVLEPQINLHQIWMMDRDGKLLFQSEHTEMVPRNINQKDESCNPCHRSFDYVEKILKEKEGTIDYELRNSSRKIAAFAQMDFENVSWTVVINSPYDEVGVFARKGLREHWMLMGIVVLALVGGSMLIVRNDRLKVKAEEEVKHWREKRALEDEMYQSEALYQAIIETAHDGIGVLDTEGNFIFLNKAGEEVSGYKLSELAGKNFAVLIHPEDLPRVKGLFHKILEDKSNDTDFEARICTKDKKIRLVLLNSGPLHKKGKVIGLSIIGRDITEHRKSENALWESEKQLRYLSSQLLTAQETERRRISKELHDELGGSLAVLKLRVSFVKKGLTQDQSTLEEECETILQYIDEVIENVRRLSRDLAPANLEHAGLSAAIHWLIANSNKNYHANITLDAVDIDHLFSRDTQIIIYRIFQEALTNIGKHAKAKNVSIAIEKLDGVVSFSLEDDGIGFDMLRTAMIKPEEGGLGLAIMHERARMLGGGLELWSEKGKGTRIRFHIPLEKGGSV